MTFLLLKTIVSSKATDLRDFYVDLCARAPGRTISVPTRRLKYKL